MKTVSTQNWDNRAKTIETKNLKKWNKTPAWLSILREMGKSVISFDSCDGSVTFDESEYKKIREHCLSEKYAFSCVPYVTDCPDCARRKNA